MDPAIPGGRRPSFDLGVPVDEVARGAATHGRDGVVGPHERSHPPDVARVGEAEEPRTRAGGRGQQRLEVAVAADHGIQRDDVGRRQVGRQLDDVAVAIVDAIGQAATLGLGAGSRQVVGRCVDVDGTLGAGLQEGDMDGAHPGTDVEQACPVDALAADDIDQFAGRGVQVAGPPSLQIGLGIQAVVLEAGAVVVAAAERRARRHLRRP